MTSRYWPPDASTATTPRCTPTVPTRSTGWASSRPSPDRRATTRPAQANAPRRYDDRLDPHRQLFGLLRRPHDRDARDARRRPTGLSDRRLSGRADHAHLGPRPAERPRTRVRQDVPEIGRAHV